MVEVMDGLDPAIREVGRCQDYNDRMIPEEFENIANVGWLKLF